MSHKSTKQKSSALDSAQTNINLIDYSFWEHKSTLNVYLTPPGKHIALVEDITDFWKFVNKYESMLRSAGQPVLPMVLQNPIELKPLQPYHKRKYICLNLSQSRNRCNDTGGIVPVHVVAQFQQIVLIYLDFKQKEKFTKLKKLRQAQKSLPIARFKRELQTALSDTRVLIVAGDTGCGKSTQVPQYLYEFGYRSIACTQPRRLACVSLSKRVAHEMLQDYGTKVGFQIRFEKSRTDRTNIVFITEGLLLRQLAVSSNVEQYDALILDEIHERNLFGDFLLGVTKCLLRAKPNLKLILMSATINVELFHDYFKEEGAKLVQVPGRLYPIKTVFMPPPALELKSSGSSRPRPGAAARLDPQPYVQVLNLIDQKYPTTERGDVLIFVSGVNEITSICDAVREYAEQNTQWIILPLHSGLPLETQDKVFDYAPEGMRKCIVSTNIAETSLTVDGIRFVIDSGKVKEMSYDTSCKGQRLKEFWVSKSSAEQRKGRAGRTGPGNCYRLYSQKQYDSFESYPSPEIFRVPLDSILLQMVSMGLPNVRAFPFIESPAVEAIEQTILSLKQHNAITAAEKITPLGTSLATLPVELTIGKMLLMGCVFPDVEKILTLAALLTVQNPFTTRAYNDVKCEQAREPLMSDQGDIFTLMNAYHEWLTLKCAREKTRKWCNQLGIEEQRFYEITKLRNQFQKTLEQCNMSPPTPSSTLTSAERARRHGEIQMLKSIKRKQKFKEPRQRKILKVQHGTGSDDENYDGEIGNNNEDIRDVDFRLKHDARKMQLLLQSANVTKTRDVVLLKLIIVSGFYPQMAIADEFNYCKGGSQQFFHTQLKPFLSMHPNAYFAKYFDILKLSDSDMQTKPDYYTPKQALSTRHQLLCYQSLLETAKPYLMNCIRLPAAQTLLLFSYELDTNATATRIVCDNWLLLEFPLPETGLELLSRALKLRYAWNKQLNDKLNELANNLDAKMESAKRHKETKSDEIELWDMLLDYINLGVAYTIKRLLPADLKSLYTHAPQVAFESLSQNPFVSDYTITANDEKGGCNVAENVIYDCLQEQQWTLAMEAALSEHNWTCKYCELDMPFNQLEVFLHKKDCKKSHTRRSNSSSATFNAHSHTSSGGQHYYCSICKRDLKLSTKIDILRHKKQCEK